MKIIQQKGTKKSDINDKYISLLKQLQIESIINRGKLQTPNFNYTDKPTLYDYLLDKHALLYENQNDEKKQQGQNDQNSSKNKSFFSFSNCLKKKQSINQSQIQRQESQPSSQNQNLQQNNSSFKIQASNSLRTDQRKSSKNNFMGRTNKRQNSQRKTTLTMDDKKKLQSDEYVEVSLFNEKQNYRQYFKVCVVPLLLQEPLLAISMEDITFISLYHQKMQQTKQIMTLSSLSFVKLKQKIEGIINDISNDQPKIKKNFLYISQMIRSFTRIDTSQIKYQNFSIRETIKQLRQLFPTILNVKYTINSNMKIQLKGQKENSKNNIQDTDMNYRQSPKLNRIQSNNQIYQGSPKCNNSLDSKFTSPNLNFVSPNLNYNNSPTLNNENSPNLIINKNPDIYLNNSPQLNTNYSNKNNDTKQNNNNTDPNILNTNPMNMFNQFMSINLDNCNDFDQVILSQSNQYIMTEEIKNNTNTIIDFDNGRHLNRKISQSIPFSQQCKTLQKINSFCNFVNTYDQNLKEKTGFTTQNTSREKNTNTSDKESKERRNSLDNYLCSSRNRLNSNFTVTNNGDESIQEKNEKSCIHANMMLSMLKKSTHLTNSQRKIGLVADMIGIVEEKQRKESESQISDESAEQEYIIYNNQSMIQYVLVGLISMFKDKKIELTISLNQSNLYKSIKILIQPKIKLAISKRLTYFEPESVYHIDDIYDLKSLDDTYNFSILAEKMFSRLNEICLLLGPNKIKLEPDSIEIEFFIEKANLCHQQQKNI